MRTTYLPADEVKGKRADRLECHGEIRYALYSTGELEIVLDALPPSKNRYIRKHWRTQQRNYFKPWEAWVSQLWWNVTDQRFEPNHPKIIGPVKISVQFGYPDKRRRDAQNLFGFPPLFDVLVNLGVIEDDNGEVSLHPPYIVEGKSKTVIRITPVKKED